MIGTENIAKQNNKILNAFPFYINLLISNNMLQLLNYDSNFDPKKTSVEDYIKNNLKIRGSSSGNLDKVFHKVFPNKYLKKYKILELFEESDLKFRSTHAMTQSCFLVNTGNSQNNGILSIIESRNNSQSSKMKLYTDTLARLYEIGLYPRIEETIVIKNGENNLLWFQYYQLDNNDVLEKRFNKVLNKIRKFKGYKFVKLLKSDPFLLYFVVSDSSSDERRYLLRVLISDRKLNNYDSIEKTLKNSNPIKVRRKLGNDSFKVFFIFNNDPIHGRLTDVLYKEKSSKFLESILHAINNKFLSKISSVDISNIGFAIINKKIKLVPFDKFSPKSGKSSLKEFSESLSKYDKINQNNKDIIEKLLKR